MNDFFEGVGLKGEIVAVILIARVSWAVFQHGKFIIFTIKYDDIWSNKIKVLFVSAFEMLFYLLVVSLASWALLLMFRGDL